LTRDDVSRKFGCLDCDLLVIDRLILDRRWRSLRLGLLVLRKLVDFHEGGCGLVVCRPHPLEGPDTPEAIRAGKIRLRRYLKGMGFRRVAKTDFYGLSTSHRTPKFEDLLNPEKG
jgi:hypothetical protein